MWKQLPPDRQATWVDNAPTFLDELRDPDGLNVDLDALAGYAQPTLLTHGDQSPPLFTPVLDRLQTLLPHAERHTYVGAGHIPHVTHPREFAADVADYARAENPPPRWLQGAVLYGPWASPGRQRADA
jgi:pimeloyl-ACP methyl ester carboxylesterase